MGWRRCRYSAPRRSTKPAGPGNIDQAGDRADDAEHRWMLAQNPFRDHQTVSAVAAAAICRSPPSPCRRPCRSPPGAEPAIPPNHPTPLARPARADGALAPSCGAGMGLTIAPRLPSTAKAATKPATPALMADTSTVPPARIQNAPTPHPGPVGDQDPAADHRQGVGQQAPGAHARSDSCENFVSVGEVPAISCGG